MDFILPSAEAGAGALVGIAAKSAISYLLSTCTALTVLIDNQMLTPLRRAVIWGVLAGMATVSVMAMSSEEDKINENIASIDRVLNSMNSMSNGVQTTQTPTMRTSSNSMGLTKNGSNAINAIATEDIDIAKGGMRFPCITGSDPNNCASVSSKMLSMPIEGLPPIVQDRIANIRGLGDGLNSTGVLSGSTMNHANAIGGRAKALSDELLRLRKEAQTKLNASGKSFNIDNESKSFEDSLKSAVQKSLNDNKITSSQAMASLSSAGLRSWNGNGSTPAPTAIDAAKEAIKKSSAPVIGAMASPVKSSALPESAFKLEDNQDELKAKLAEEEAARLKALAEEEAKKPKSMDEFVLGNDITKDKDTSIFEIISTRYKKSYNRLFEAIK